MSITLKTHKMLWRRSANRCAICKLELVMDATETDDESLVGEACHIVARSSNWSRGDAQLTSNQRDKYTNLLLLCNTHHKLVDDQPGKYSVEYLQSIKNDHEAWVRQQLSFDHQKQRDDEMYASYIDEWASRINLDSWMDWTSSIFSNDQPSLYNRDKEALEAVRLWLLSRVWPERYTDLEYAFHNYQLVVEDFYSVFLKHGEQRGDWWWTEKFYQVPDWNPQRYQKLSVDYDLHVGLVQDLGLEMTRAANYICHVVRQTLNSSYRLKEGAALVHAGPFSNLSYRIFRVRYKPEELSNQLYPGLEEFQAVRFTRDFWFGEKPASTSANF